MTSKGYLLATAQPYASIVPPPFGSGYPWQETGTLAQLTGLRLQLCRPLSEAVIPNRRRPQSASTEDLQLCRPLSEAVIGLGYPSSRSKLSILQLCRPLSEAVIPHRRCGPNIFGKLQLCRPLSEAVMGIESSQTSGSASPSASIVPPPFGSGYWYISLPQGRIVTFNCAAPFRKRLCRSQARPWSSEGPSIVPPPFGSGYPPAVATYCRSLVGPSIVPPPFGSGYRSSSPEPGTLHTCFNCAAPFRKRLFSAEHIAAMRILHPSIVPPPFGSGYPYDSQQRHRRRNPFNCAAPFRERLWPRPRRAIVLPGQLPPSIVPPPFGSGYTAPPPDAGGDAVTLQLCRPLSGAVMRGKSTARAYAISLSAPSRRRSAPASIVPPPFGSGYFHVRAMDAAPHSGRRWARTLCFNCAAPFRKRLSALASAAQLSSHRPSIVPPPFGSGYLEAPTGDDGGDPPRASIVPPPFGSGYAKIFQAVRGATAHMRFNCAAPFRKRL